MFSGTNGAISVSSPAPARCRGGLALWRDVVLPREHGSWSLALEPLVLGLVAAPSWGGGWLATAVLAGFFARRPLRIALGDASSARRRAACGPLAVLVGVALVALGSAIAWGGIAWLVWLSPVAAAGGVFLYFDLRAAGREEIAEVAGAGAFAAVPAALAVLAGWDAASAAVLAGAMIGRAVPAVLTVRACLRAAKTGERRATPALLGATVACLAGFAAVQAGLAPVVVGGLLGLLAGRTAVLLLWPRPTLRARTLGMIETGLGVFFVLVAALAWRA